MLALAGHYGYYYMLLCLLVLPIVSVGAGKRAEGVEGRGRDGKRLKKKADVGAKERG